MSDSEVNPFEAPQSDLRDNDSAVGSRSDLQTVAGWQRTLMLCLITFVIGVPIQFVSPIPLKAIIAVVFLIAFVIGAFFTYGCLAGFGELCQGYCWRFCHSLPRSVWPLPYSSSTKLEHC
jgi:hypothetical protein